MIRRITNFFSNDILTLFKNIDIDKGSFLKISTLIRRIDTKIYILENIDINIDIDKNFAYRTPLN